MASEITVFIHKNGDYFMWYVLCNTHVLDQGTAKTKRTAQARADRSRAAFAYDLLGELV